MPVFPPLDLRETKEGVIFKVSVQPKSSRMECSGIQAGALRLRLTASPVEGAANEACRAFLADLFHISKSRIQIVRGHRSRQKWIQIQGGSREAVLQRLSGLPVF